MNGHRQTGGHGRAKNARDRRSVRPFGFWSRLSALIAPCSSPPVAVSAVARCPARRPGRRGLRLLAPGDCPIMNGSEIEQSSTAVDSVVTADCEEPPGSNYQYFLLLRQFASLLAAGMPSGGRRAPRRKRKRERGRRGQPSARAAPATSRPNLRRRGPSAGRFTPR